MTRLRLLPIVLFASSSLLVLKVLGLTTGSGSFGVGPTPAIAAGAEAAAGASGPAAATPAIMAPLNLAAEAEQLRRQEEEAAAAAAKAAGEDAAAGAEDHGGGEHGDAAAAPDGVETPAAAGDAPAPDGEASADAGDAAAGEGDAPAAAGDAPAEEPPAADAHGGDHEQAAGEEAAVPGLSTVRPDEFVPESNSSEPAVIESLADRRRQLEQREEEIELRMKLLEAAEAKLQKRVDELKNIESQLGGAVEETKKSEQEKLKGLVSMYENMKPKSAAQVFNNLEMPVLLALVEIMNPRKMSGILAVMDPAKAGALTVALAGNQGPTEVVIRRDVGGDAGLPPVPDGAPTELPKIMPAPPR